MRRTIAFLLLAATAASPLAAQAWIGQGNGPDRADRRDGRDDPRGADRTIPRPDERSIDHRADARPDPRGDWRDGDRAGVVARQGWRDDDHPGRDGRPGWNDGRGPGDRRDDRRGPDGRRDWNGRGPDGRGPGWRDDGPGRQWSDNGRGGWNGGWRNDRRYDWQDYRAGNRAIYRAPRYYGPRGTDYSRWSRGYRVQPYFYGRNYWIADPWRYRLPPAYGSYRWVRYYDDVALVDVRSGLIEDIIYSFFYR